MRDGRHARLAEDLRAARDAAVAAARGSSDGGSANHDAVALSLKGWRESTVKRLAGSVGLGAHKLHSALWRGSFLISFPGGGQGASNTVAQEAAVKVLRERGWEALMFWQVD